MKHLDWNALDEAARREALARPAQSRANGLRRDVEAAQLVELRDADDDHRDHDHEDQDQDPAHGSPFPPPMRTLAIH